MSTQHPHTSVEKRSVSEVLIATCAVASGVSATVGGVKSAIDIAKDIKKRPPKK